MVKSHESPRIIRPEADFFDRIKKLPGKVAERGTLVVSSIVDHPTNDATEMYKEVFPNSGERNYSPDELMERASTWIDQNIRVEREEGESEEDYNAAVRAKQAEYKQSVAIFIKELFTDK